MTDVFATHVDLTVAGGPVRLYRGGESGPPLLLLHGAMLDTAKGVWRRVAHDLAADHRVYVIDLPRHGGSRPWTGVLDDAFYGRFLDELLDTLDLPRVALIGLSLGGGVAASYALRRPERVNALLAVGPGGIGAKRQAQFFTWLFMRTPGALRLTTSYLARRPGAIRKSMMANLVQGERTPDFDDILLLASEEAVAKEQHGELALDDWQIHSYGPFSMRLDLLPDLHRLSMPSLWVRGDRDPLVGPAELAAAAEAAPGSRLITMADAGHIVTYDQPDHFTELAREFLISVSDAEPK